MMVCAGGTWFPYTSIKELVERGPIFVAPKAWSAHVEVLLVSGSSIRVEGMTAAELSDDINRQIADAYRNHGVRAPM